MLVTLLVLWVVVVPALTLAGTYILSGLGRRSGVRSLDLTVGSVRIAGAQRHLAPIRMRSHTSRSRDHALIQR